MDHLLILAGVDTFLFLARERETVWKFVHLDIQKRKMRFGKFSPTNMNSLYRVGKVWSFEPISFVVRTDSVKVELHYQ